MADLPIVIPNTAAAPKDYTLSGGQELQLKSVRALIDGTGAGSSFKPTLQLLDPNGHVMWEGAATSAVAAGGSADVSWFPGVIPASDGIKFDQPNTDPLGAVGELVIDTGLVEFGNVIQADWEVTAVDTQWHTTGGSGFDLQTDGSTLQLNSIEVAGVGGVFIAAGERSATLQSGNTALQIRSGGVYQLSATLPIADPGVSGQLWNNGGVLHVSP